MASKIYMIQKLRDDNLYKKLKRREYKDNVVCQYDKCDKPLKRFGKDRRNKYCCDEHAEKAKKLYRKMWNLRNYDKVRKHKITSRKKKLEIALGHWKIRLRKQRERKRREKINQKLAIKLGIDGFNNDIE